MTHVIRKCCDTTFSCPIRTRKQYKEPLHFNISANEVFAVRREILSRDRAKKPEKQSEELKNDLKQLRLVSKFFRPQSTQGVRDKYKSKPGFAPSVISFSKRAPTPEKKMVDKPAKKKKKSAAATPKLHAILEAGDIVGVLPSDDQKTYEGDDWWLFKLTRDVYHAGSNDPVYGGWLDYETTDDEGNQIFTQNAETNMLSIVNLLKDRSRSPFVQIKEYYGVVDERIIVHPDCCHMLDELVVLAADLLLIEEGVFDESTSEDEEPIREGRAKDIIRAGRKFILYYHFHQGK